MEHVVRSAYFSKLQSAMVRGGQHKFLPYTTLNEKFNVMSREYPPAGVYPTLAYLAIGRGGMGMGLGADGEADVIIHQHKTTDAALFDHMPFSLRPLDNDLPPERRSRYAMRVQKQFNGVTYWAYYLKRVDFSSSDTDLFLKRTLPDGSTEVEEFTPDESNLNPQPVDLSDSGTNLLAGMSVIASTIITLPLDDFDIAEIRKASEIIKGRTGKAIVTEVALCTGVPKQINAPGQNGTFAFWEAIGVQIASFVQALYALDYINQDLSDQLELGISEPLFKLEGVNT